MLPGPAWPARPSFPRLVGAETNAQAQETLAPGDPLGQEARRACRELLQLQRLKRQVEGELESPCSRATCAGETSPVASALADRGILHSPRVGLSEK
jgi:hypothetical protein